MKEPSNISTVINPIISGIVLKSLQNVVDKGNDGNTINNPKEFNKCRTRVVGACMAACVFSRVSSLHPHGANGQIFNEMISEINLMSNGTSRLVACFNKLSDYERSCLQSEAKALALFDFSNINLMQLYESILSRQFHLQDGEVIFKSGKSERNRLGAYYTPDDLANASVTYVLDTLIERRLNIPRFSQRQQNNEEKPKVRDLLLRTKFADLSCGTGKFLLALLRYFERHVLNNQETGYSNEELKAFIMNFHGVDVDYVALEIGKVELAVASNDLGLIAELAPNFIHGNPLITELSFSSHEEKEEAFEAGLFYSRSLGLNLKNQTFDIVIGNPPWEKVRFEEKEFFSTFSFSISNISDKSNRSSIIKSVLGYNEGLSSFYHTAQNDIERFKKTIKTDNRFMQFSSGEPNTYALFVELALNHRSDDGLIGLILKSALVTSQVNKRLFSHLLEPMLVIAVFDFVNSKKIFDIDSRERFCLLLLGNQAGTEFEYAVNLTSPRQIFEKNLHQKMNRSLLKKLNPDTSMLPNIADVKHMNMIVDINDGNPMFSAVYTDARFGRIVHLTNHSSFITHSNNSSTLPIYEGKFFEQYDGRFSGFNGVKFESRFGNKVSSKVLSEWEKMNESFVPEARFYIEKRKWHKLTEKFVRDYSLMWRSLTSATNRRTCIATILPHMPTSQSVQLLQLDDNYRLAILLAVFNSLVFDYLVRAKLSGIDLTKTIITQIPVPPISCYDLAFEYNGVYRRLGDHIIDRVCILLNNDLRLRKFILELGNQSQGLKLIDPSEDRQIIRHEIDLLIAKAYRIDSKVFTMVQSSFQKLNPALDNVLNQKECAFLDAPI